MGTLPDIGGGIRIMPQVRPNRKGDKFTGYMIDKGGNRVPVGTFGSREEALAEARQAENRGMVDHPMYMTLSMWFPKYIDTTVTLGKNTKRQYASLFTRHIQPAIGGMLVREITRRDIVSLRNELLAKGVSAHNVNKVLSTIASCYHPLLEAEMIDTPPTAGVKFLRVNRKDLEVVELDEYRAIWDCLPTDGAKLLVDILIGMGLRFGEATELRPKDFTCRRGIADLHVQRVVTDVPAKEAGGSRFEVLAGTKGKWNARKTRHVQVPQNLYDRIIDWIEDNKLGPNDLLLPMVLVDVPCPVEDVVVVGDYWEEGSRSFRHGTTYSYGSGGCRCELCTTAVRVDRRNYKARYSRLPKPAKGRVNTTGHLPRDVWARMWKQAIKASDIGWTPRTHDLRHACASHMLEFGATLLEVKEQLGHGSITTTERYLHTLNRNVQKASPFDATWADRAC